MEVDLLSPVFVPTSEILDLLCKTPPRSASEITSEDERLYEMEEKFEMTRIRHLATYTATCFMLAAKYDELDENIPLISDLERYYTIKVLPP